MQQREHPIIMLMNYKRIYELFLSNLKHFFRFIHEIILCVSFSELFHLAPCPQGPFLLLQTAGFLVYFDPTFSESRGRNSRAILGDLCSLTCPCLCNTDGGRRRGLKGTGIAAVERGSESPRGKLYHVTSVTGIQRMLSRVLAARAQALPQQNTA